MYLWIYNGLPKAHLHTYTLRLHNNSDSKVFLNFKNGFFYKTNIHEKTFYHVYYNHFSVYLHLNSLFANKPSSIFCNFLCLKVLPYHPYFIFVLFFFLFLLVIFLKIRIALKSYYIVELSGSISVHFDFLKFFIMPSLNIDS